MKEKEEYNFENAERGPIIKSSPNKTRITIRIDKDILKWFRDRVHKMGGGNYQTLINEALRSYIQQKDGVWVIQGTCPIDLEGHPWTERFEVIVDRKGKVTSTYFSLL